MVQRQPASKLWAASAIAGSVRNLLRRMGLCDEPPDDYFASRFHSLQMAGFWSVALTLYFVPFFLILGAHISQVLLWVPLACSLWAYSSGRRSTSVHVQNSLKSMWKFGNTLSMSIQDILQSRHIRMVSLEGTREEAFDCCLQALSMMPVSFIERLDLIEGKIWAAAAAAKGDSPRPVELTLIEGDGTSTTVSIESYPRPGGTSCDYGQGLANVLAMASYLKDPSISKLPVINAFTKRRSGFSSTLRRAITGIVILFPTLLLMESSGKVCYLLACSASHRIAGDADQALAKANQAVLIGSSRAADTYNARGLANLKLGRTNDALADFTTAIENSAVDEPEYYMNRADAYCQNHDYDKALDELNDCGSGTTVNEQSLYHRVRGRIFHRQGKNDDALEELNTSLDSQDSLSAFAERAEVEDALGMKDGSAEDRQEANKIITEERELQRNDGIAIWILAAIGILTIPAGQLSRLVGRVWSRRRQHRTSIDQELVLNYDFDDAMDLCLASAAEVAGARVRELDLAAGTITVSVGENGHQDRTILLKVKNESHQQSKVLIASNFSRAESEKQLEKISTFLRPFSQEHQSS